MFLHHIFMCVPCVLFCRWFYKSDSWLKFSPAAAAHLPLARRGKKGLLHPVQSKKLIWNLISVQWNLFLCMRGNVKSAERVLRAWCIRGAHARIINNGLLHKNVIQRRTVHLSSCIIILIIARRCVDSFFVVVSIGGAGNGLVIITRIL